MQLEKVRRILDAKVITGEQHMDMEIQMGCGSDLMSDVLAFIKEDTLLLTGLTTIQVVYTAEMSGIKAICFVRGKVPPEETKRLAESKEIVLLSTDLPMFESCGKLYHEGIKGCSQTEFKKNKNNGAGRRKWKK
jgi:hypothetical protein